MCKDECRTSIAYLTVVWPNTNIMLALASRSSCIDVRKQTPDHSTHATGSQVKTEDALGRERRAGGPLDWMDSCSSVWRSGWNRIQQVTSLCCPHYKSTWIVSPDRETHTNKSPYVQHAMSPVLNRNSKPKQDIPTVM